MITAGGARVNAKDNKWLTPLHRACRSGSEVSIIIINLTTWHDVFSLAEKSPEMVLVSAAIFIKHFYAYDNVLLQQLFSTGTNPFSCSFRKWCQCCYNTVPTKTCVTKIGKPQVNILLEHFFPFLLTFYSL